MKKQKQTLKQIQAANGKIADEALRRVRQSKHSKVKMYDAGNGKKVTIPED
jgi:hypothetical protein